MRDLLRAAPRRAISLLEVVVAAAMLAVLMTIAAQMLQAVGQQQRATQRRALALQTVHALAEQFSNMPWDQLTAEAADEVNVPIVAQAHLPGAKLSVTIQEEQQPIAAKRVMVALAWNGPSGRFTGPVRLTTWVFQNESLPP
jgi:hypothetical protein